MNWYQKNRRCCWSVCMLAHGKTQIRTHTHTHTNFIVYVFLHFNKTTSVRIPNIRIWLCCCVTTRWWCVQQLCVPHTSIYILRTQTYSHTCGHIAEAVFFFSTRGTVLFLHMCFLAALQIVASKHTHTHTYARQPHFVLWNVCYAFICLLFYSLSQPVSQTCYSFCV